MIHGILSELADEGRRREKSCRKMAAFTLRKPQDELNHSILSADRRAPRRDRRTSLRSPYVCRRESLRKFHVRIFPSPFAITGNLYALPAKDVSNEESRTASLRESPWHGGRLHWLETGCTSNFCNEIPQTSPRAMRGSEGGQG